MNKRGFSTVIVSMLLILITLVAIGIVAVAIGDIIQENSKKISIDGIELTRKDGTKREVRFHPSNLMITDMILEDKKRKMILERKKQ